MASILKYIEEQASEKSIWILVDPDKDKRHLDDLVMKANSTPIIKLFLIGGSFIFIENIDEVVLYIKSRTKLPVVLFPGSASHLSKEVDALLLLSVISSRNPQMLIGDHVNAAPKIKELSLEAIPTSYILISGGVDTAVEYMTQSKPIPSESYNIAAATALAGQQLGHKLTYLEAGSGAKSNVSTEMVSVVKRTTNLPLIVGGGIRSADTCDKVFKAGADIIVLGNILEEDSNFIALLQEI